MKPHKNLIAWQKGMELVVATYELTKRFPKDETFGLSSQLKRAAISVPSNIAEGACDRSPDQFRNFLGIALGSLNEINTQLEVAFRVGYLDKTSHDAIQELVDECMALTYGLRRSVGKAK